MSEKKSFWGSIPGFATGLAAVVTAGLGLWGVVAAGDSSNSSRPPQEDKASPAEQGASTSTGRAEATLSPTELNFGSSGLSGSSDTLTLTLTNTGTKKLSIEDTEIAGTDASQFKIVEDECGATRSVRAKDECEIGIRFSPTSVGDFQASLTVDHTGEESQSEASLTGKGVLLQF